MIDYKNHLVLGSGYTPNKPSKIVKGSLVNLKDSGSISAFNTFSAHTDSTGGSIDFCSSLNKSIFSYYKGFDDIGVSQIFGSDTTYEFAAETVKTTSTAYDVTSGKVVVAYQTSTDCFCNYGAIVVSPQSITYNAANKAQINATQATNMKLVYNPNSTKTILSYFNGNGKIKIVNNGSGAVTYGTEYTFSTGGGDYLDMSSSSSSGFLLVYTDSNFKIQGRYITASGASLTLGAEYEIKGSDSLYCKCVNISANKYLVVWVDGSTKQGLCKVITYDGSWSAGTETTWSGDTEITSVSVSYDADKDIASIFYRCGDSETVNSFDNYVLSVQVNTTEIALRSRTMLVRQSYSAAYNESISAVYNSNTKVLDAIMFDAFGRTFSYVYGDSKEFKGISTTLGLLLPCKGNTVELSSLNNVPYYIEDTDFTEIPERFTPNTFLGVSSTIGFQTYGEVVPDFIYSNIAGGTITAGNQVKIGHDNKLYKVNGITSTSAQTINSTSITLPKVVNIDEEKYVAIFHDGTNLKYNICTITETGITVGTTTVIGAGYNASEVDAIYDSIQSRIVVVYKSSDNKGYAIGGSLSGTSITWGTAIAITSGTVNYLKVTYDNVQGKAAASYFISTGGYTVIISAATNNVTLGTPVRFTTDTVIRGISTCFDSLNNSVFIHWQESTTFGFFISGTVSGTTIVFGDPADAISETPNFCFFDSSLNKIIVSTTDNTYYYVDNRNNFITSQLYKKYSVSTYNMTYAVPFMDNLNNKSSTIFYDNSTNNINMVRYYPNKERISINSQNTILNIAISNMSGSYSKKFHKVFILYGISGFAKGLIVTPDDRVERLGTCQENTTLNNNCGVRLNNAFALEAITQETGTDIVLKSDGSIGISADKPIFQEPLDNNVLGIQLTATKGLMYVK